MDRSKRHSLEIKGFSTLFIYYHSIISPLCVCVRVCKRESVYVCVLPTEVRRESWLFLKLLLQAVVSSPTWVGAENQAHVFWESSKCL